ncbi:MAG: hypothetical protein OJI67_02320, partial [Prosthecobacter sp.]|nr:hypothetical protein [Prosthecobacter sp.]
FAQLSPHLPCSHPLTVSCGATDLLCGRLNVGQLGLQLAVSRLRSPSYLHISHAVTRSPSVAAQLTYFADAPT